MACNPQPDARILDTYIRGINRTLIGASNPPAFIQAQQAISHGQGVPYGVWMSLSPTEQKQIAALNAQATAAAMQAKASAASAAAASAAAARAAATRVQDNHRARPTKRCVPHRPFAGRFRARVQATLFPPSTRR